MSDEQLPVTISIVGTGNGEGGGVAPTQSGTLATTPGSQPNLIINVITPMMAIAVRAITLFLKTWLGLITVALTPMGQTVLPSSDFVQLIWNCAGLSVSVVVVGLIKDSITVFGGLEGKWPLGTGSI